MKQYSEILAAVLIVFFVVTFSHCKKDDSKDCKTCTAKSNGQVIETKSVCSVEEETAFRKSHLDASVSCE